MDSDPLFIIKKWIELTLHKSMHSIFKFSREHNISMPQIGILIRIYRKGKANISDIGDHMGVSSAASSQLIDKMVQFGLLDRSEDINDRRIKKIDLTQKGLKIVTEIFRTSYEWIEDLIAQFNLDEKEEIITVLNKLIEKANFINNKIDSDE
ncbi:MAG: MarR family winged helix-turn-helix transcriptional regulator [Promethearchaeota archaeon]